MPTPAAAPTLISLDPPYRLDAKDATYVFHGWAEVDDEAAPDIHLRLNGVEVPVVTYPNTGVAALFPGVRASSFYAKVDMRQLLGAGEAAEPFLLEAGVASGGRNRVFEYAVTPAWLEAVFGRPLRARRIPPEHLQIRVTGAAAGRFHTTGREVAEQIAGILSAGGHPLQARRSILDFGSGPGRVISSIADLNPQAALAGSDIDAEAIGWAQENLSDIATFAVNGELPPLPFPDEAFDLVYSISTFTHFPDELQWAWLKELRRVLKPGGLLLTTKLNAAAYDLPADVQREFQAKGFVYWGEAALTDGLPTFYRLAYHTDAFVRREWGRYFEVLRIGSHDLNNTQDSVLLRRPRHGLSWLPLGVRRGLFAAARAIGLTR